MKQTAQPLLGWCFTTGGAECEAYNDPKASPQAAPSLNCNAARTISSRHWQNQQMITPLEKTTGRSWHTTAAVMVHLVLLQFRPIMLHVVMLRVGLFRNCYSHSTYIQSKPHPIFTWCIFVLGKLLFSYTHIPRGYSFSLYLFSCLFLHLSRHLLVDLKSPWPCLLWYVPIAIVRSSILTGCASPYCPLRSSRQQSSLHHKVLDLMARQPYQVVPMRLSQHRAQHQPPHKRAIGTPRTFLHKTSGSRGNVWRL